MENVLVAGATGTTGKKIVELLRTSQYFTPVAMVRNENQVPQFKEKGIRTVVGNLLSDLTHVTKGIDKVVFAAGSGGQNVVEVDQEGAKKLVDAAENQKIKKFVMLSSMGADHPENAEDLKEYLQAKHNADEYLKASSLIYTIVRPGTLTNDKGTGHIRLNKHIDTQGSISRDDVAQTLVRVLHDDAGINQTFEILEGDSLISEALDKVS